VLPILRPKKSLETGLILEKKSPEPEESQEDSSAAIDECSHQLIQSVHAGDIQGVSDAITKAFSILDSLPHQEGPHKPSPHTYENQSEE
jgi:hypothetical protein